jgi:hypothetical protein
MNIQININLDHYSPLQIIDLYQKGLLTLNEVIRSKRQHSTFGSELNNFIYEEQKRLKIENAKHLGANDDKTALI